MVLMPGCDDQLTSFIVSSWENSFEKNRKRRSRTHTVYENAMVQASTNLRKFISPWSSEVKYIALSEDVKTVVWIRNVLTESGVKKA